MGDCNCFGDCSKYAAEELGNYRFACVNRRNTKRPERTEMLYKRCLGIKEDRNGGRQGGWSLERTSKTENLRKKDNSQARMTSTVLKLDLNT